MVYEHLSKIDITINPFIPFPKAKDRSAWKPLNSQWVKESLELGQTYKDFAFQSLSASDFMELSINGNRTNYENKLFAKRKALSSLVIAECLEYKGNYITDIINGIFSICEESAWFLPAHNTYIRDAVQLPLPDACDPVLELFSCETGAILATTLYLLEDELNKVSPFITKRIRYELNQRVFVPFLNRHFWWMGKGDERMCNWTIWCTQNVLITAFLSNANYTAELEKSADDKNLDISLSIDEPSINNILTKIIYKAAKSTDFYLKDFGEDGCCDEGAQYYRHSALCLYNVLDILNKVLDGQMEALFQSQKIKNMATYIMNVHVSGPYYFNFADCAPIAGRASAREFLFGKAIGNTHMMEYAATDFFEGSLSAQDENNLYYRLQNGFSANEMLEYVQEPSETVSAKEFFYESTGMFISGDTHFSLAVKAGNNGDSHNHNDTGSFTIYANGLPLIIDIGVESYTKKTFSDKRYEIWTMQSAFHNLPTINGIMQKDGIEYAAKNVSYNFSEEVSFITMDISDAYPLKDVLQGYTRKISLYKGSKISICDKIVSNLELNAIQLSLMTYEKPVLTNTDCLSIGTLGKVNFEGCSLLEIEEHPITDSRLAATWKHSIYRTLFTATDSNLCFTIY